ncbi:unnamed protein product [Microthlaspi erraticum]|uniref:Uncharacterized protein n=1 Tax=Microthlaspi erraticum TaxID=1685480 RepID=A0A6D2KP24_9BRAS|nr:unnamed protein product [Microthlaspi erraticum]
MLNENVTNEDDLFPDPFDSEMPHNQVPETEGTEEVYRVNIDEETHPSNEFTYEHIRRSSSTVDPIQIPTSRVQNRSRGRRGSTLQRSAGSSRVSQGSGPRGSRKKQSFEATLTDTMAGFREFQRQSIQQLRPNAFDQDDYNEFDVAVKIFESMELPNDTDFTGHAFEYLEKMHSWRKYFIDRADKPFEEKIQFLQAVTGLTRNDERVEKRLSSGKHFGSQSSGGCHSGSPSSGGNNSWGQTSSSQWGPGFQQWGTPPNAQQWGTPPNAQQWGHHQMLNNGAPPNAHLLHNGEHNKIPNNGVHRQ